MLGLHPCWHLRNFWWYRVFWCESNFWLRFFIKPLWAAVTTKLFPTHCMLFHGDWHDCQTKHLHVLSVHWIKSHSRNPLLQFSRTSHGYRICTHKSTNCKIFNLNFSSWHYKGLSVQFLFKVITWAWDLERSTTTFVILSLLSITCRENKQSSTLKNLSSPLLVTKPKRF